jgi:hypothetical protein
MAREPDWSAIFYVLVAMIAVIAIAAVGLPAIVGVFQNSGGGFGLWQGLFVVFVLVVVAYVVRAKKSDR